MTQSTDITLSNQSGANFRTELNSILQAVMSNHKGSSEPSYIVTGATWVDDSTTPWNLKIHDGAASFAFLEINPSTNNVTLVNVKDADARTEGPSLGQIQDGGANVVGSVSGTNTITGSLTPAITAYATGMIVNLTPSGANTTAATLNLNGLGAKALQIDGQALVGGELSNRALAVYDGTQFQIITPTSRQPFKSIRFPYQSELTIASGAITVTGTNHYVDTESDAASDDLDTINGGYEGGIVILRAAHTDRTVVVKHNTGNILTPNEQDISLDTTSKTITLIYDSSQSKFIALASYIPQTSGIKKMPTMTHAADTDHDITVSTCSVPDSTLSKYLVLGSALTKQIDASYAAGNNAGGMFTGTVANNTWYHLIIIEKDSDGTIDVGYDTSITGANRPAGHTKYAYSGYSVYTDGSANIRQTVHSGDMIYWKDPPLDHSASVTAGTGVNATLSVPTGIRVEAKVNVINAGGSSFYTRPTDVNDESISASAAPLSSGYDGSNNAGGQVTVLTDTSAQAHFDTNSTGNIYVSTIGWRFLG